MIEREREDRSEEEHLSRRRRLREEEREGLLEPVREGVEVRPGRRGPRRGDEVAEELLLREREELRRDRRGQRDLNTAQMLFSLLVAKNLADFGRCCTVIGCVSADFRTDAERDLLCQAYGQSNQITSQYHPISRSRSTFDKKRDNESRPLPNDRSSKSWHHLYNAKRPSVHSHERINCASSMEKLKIYSIL